MVDAPTAEGRIGIRIFINETFDTPINQVNSSFNTLEESYNEVAREDEVLSRLGTIEINHVTRRIDDKTEVVGLDIIFNSDMMIMTVIADLVNTIDDLIDREFREDTVMDIEVGEREDIIYGEHSIDIIETSQIAYSAESVGKLAGVRRPGVKSEIVVGSFPGNEDLLRDAMAEILSLPELENSVIEPFEPSFGGRPILSINTKRDTVSGEVFDDLLDALNNNPTLFIGAKASRL